MKVAGLIAYILVVVGAVNWLLIGTLSFDLVAFLFGELSILSRIVYGLVGLSGLWLIFYAIAYQPFKGVNG